MTNNRLYPLWIIFSSSEIELINQANSKIDLFFTLWCLKERYVKYTGTGLTVSLNSFSFFPKNDSPFVEFYSNGQNYPFPYFYTSSINNNYKLAICSDNKSFFISKLDILDLLQLYTLENFFISSYICSSITKQSIFSLSFSWYLRSYNSLIKSCYSSCSTKFALPKYTSIPYTTIFTLHIFK